MSAIGGEVSNDHHAVYDLQASDTGAVRNVHVYYEDIAGIEGVRWYVVAGVVFVAGTLFLTALFILVSSGRLAARGLGLAARIPRESRLMRHHVAAALGCAPLT